MKFKMGMNMLDMVGVVHSRLADVKFPFLVMHDPGDGEKETPPTSRVVYYISSRGAIVHPLACIRTTVQHCHLN